VFSEPSPLGGGPVGRGSEARSLEPARDSPPEAEVLLELDHSFVVPRCVYELKSGQI
jgi:hypothetical protein